LTESFTTRVRLSKEHAARQQKPWWWVSIRAGKTYTQDAVARNEPRHSDSIDRVVVEDGRGVSDT
jgi:hypothetical protein